MALLSRFQKLKAGLGKTREQIFTKIQRVLSAKSTIDEETLEKIEEILILSDIGVRTTSLIIENLKMEVKEHRFETNEELLIHLKNEILKVFNSSVQSSFGILPAILNQRPYVIMVVGVNGTGKTTTIGKLANQFRENGQKVLIGAADTFRAAANEQLEIWAKRAGVEIIQQKAGSDPASIAFDTISSAIAKDIDIVIIDTAGRLHTKVNLMEELKKIRRVIEKRLPSSPSEVLLVIDAGTGQNALQQVKQFQSAVGVTGIVLTKLDGTAKGGVILSIVDEMKIPVRFVGVGEQLDDLQVFDKDDFVAALFEGFVPITSSEN